MANNMLGFKNVFPESYLVTDRFHVVKLIMSLATLKNKIQMGGN
jgi:hypothetical protein